MSADSRLQAGDVPTRTDDFVRQQLTPRTSGGNCAGQAHAGKESGWRTAHMPPHAAVFRTRAANTTDRPKIVKPGLQGVELAVRAAHLRR